MEDLNQNIESKEMQEFLIRNRLIEVYKYASKIPNGDYNNTHK